MQQVTLAEAEPEEGGVFVDNLALASVMRVLSAGYDSLPADYFVHPAAAQLLLAHDVLNLAGVLEAIICHEQLYVNAQFVDTWAQSLAPGDNALTDVVTAVRWTKDFQWRAESSIVTGDWPRDIDDSLPKFSNVLASVVSAGTHHTSNVNRKVEFDESLIELTSYHERTRPFGSGGMDLIVGTGFYTTCSQILGIPFRPSALRAAYLRRILITAVRDFRVDVGREAFSALEASREEAVKATAFTARMVEMNLVDTAVPAVLAAILARSRSRREIIPVTLALRESAGGRKFRKWNAELVRSIQTGDLRDAARRAREIDRIVKEVNRSFGLEDPHTGSISVGWGPVSAGKAFDLPQRLSLPIRFSRHAWFLQRIYASMLSIARLEDRVDELFVRELSGAFQRRLEEGGGMHWRQVMDEFEWPNTMYRPL